MKSKDREKRTGIAPEAGPASEQSNGGRGAPIVEPVNGQIGPHAPNGRAHASDAAPGDSPVSGRARTGAAPRGVGLLDVLWFLPRLVMRLFFPRLADRYVIGELIGPLAFAWSLFIVMFVFTVNLYRLAQMLARGASVPDITEMLGLRVIMASVYCLPMAVLLSGLLAFGRLSGDSEIVATQAGGIPNLRLIRNAFLLGLVLSFAGLAINEYVIPPASRRYSAVEEQVKSRLRDRIVEALSEQKAFIIQDFDGNHLARIVAARKFEPAVPANPPDPARPAMLNDVLFIQHRPASTRVEMVVQAERAEYVGPSPDQPGLHAWKFIHANTQMMAEVSHGQRWEGYSDELELKMSKPPEKMKDELRDPEDLSYRELAQRIADLKAGAGKRKLIRELDVELERKLSIPFAAVVFAMVGAALGIRRQRSTAGVGIGLSLIIIVAYYVGMSCLGVLGQNGQISALAAAWGCNVAGLVIGLFLTWRTSR